ncbi:MAG: NAD(P)-binding domain-containing protein [Candidatus Gastranaerophilales bacterium]|nr:NAD(P)-binding domain-containing protein [Candidatus Gastranaerophilales bacterium]
MKDILFFNIDFKVDKKLIKFNLDNYNVLFFEHNIDSVDFEDANLDNVEIISVFTSSNLNEEILSKFVNLKCIILRSTGYNNVDLSYCKEHGIKVYNIPSYGEKTVSEYAFGILLTLIRHINKSFIDIKNCKISNDKYVGFELYQKKLGIVGLGKIGKHLAKIANGFGMNIFAYDIKYDDSFISEYDITKTSLDDMLKTCEILILTLPLNEHSYHLIDKEKFNIMKDGMTLVNVSRGEIIVTEDLYNALLDKKIGYCALDVLECEQNICPRGYNSPIKCEDYECMKKTLINHKILNLDNVIVTSHIGYNTKEAIENIQNMTIANIHNFLSNRNINLVS